METFVEWLLDNKIVLLTLLAVAVTFALLCAALLYNVTKYFKTAAHSEIESRKAEVRKELLLKRHRAEIGKLKVERQYIRMETGALEAARQDAQTRTEELERLWNERVRQEEQTGRPERERLEDERVQRTLEDQRRDDERIRQQIEEARRERYDRLENNCLEAERTGEEVFVPVHYATDRTVTGNAEPNHYYGSDRGQLQYGRALVSIPKVHFMGQIERPTILRLEFSENPQKHVVLRNVEEMDKAQFFADLASEVARLQEKAVFVFIHGFNVTFAEAARRAAQMAYDLFLVGHEKGEATFSTVPILYSWPSKGETILYTHDVNNAEASVAHLKSFLKDVKARSGAESITIIAHSMGSRTLTTALNEVGLEMREGDGPVVKEIVLAAPDIDRNVFLNVIEAVRRTAERVTLYASSQDKALQVSMALNGFPRLGDATNGVVVFNGGDSIDASAVGSNILAHSYFSETSILADLYALILRGIPPDNRFGLLSQGTPTKRYWIMRPRAGA